MARLADGVFMLKNKLGAKAASLPQYHRLALGGKRMLPAAYIWSGVVGYAYLQANHVARPP
jgi:hypothetical protein